MNRKSCVVIGAGLSGLSAALLLTKKNWEVNVLEANPWAGGRVYSYRFPEAPELVCELGGEWVGEDHDAVIRLCNEFHLCLMPHRFDFFFFEKGRRGKHYRAGSWPFPARAKREFNQLKNQNKRWGPKQRNILDMKDWWTILRDRGFGEADLLHRDLMDSTDFGESIRQVGGYSAAAEYFESNKYDEMDMKIVGGNIELVRALERAIEARGGKIWKSQEVKEIDQDGRHVRVRTANKKSFPASYCICTVPTRTLTSIAFHPELPQDRWDSAKRLQYARIMKTAILCKERFWMKRENTKFSCFSDATSDFIFDATLNQPGRKGILCSYAIGDKADDLAGYLEHHLQEKLHDDLQRIFTKERIEILKIKRQPWQFDPLTQGAYAFYRPGQWFTVREVLAKPHERVYFAGEHIAEDQGFMEGAVDTGEAAARAILKKVPGNR